MIPRLACALVGLGLVCAALTGCAGSRGLAEFLSPVEVSVFRHHIRQSRNALQELAIRLYAKNPKYEKDPARRRAKINSIFGPLATTEQVYAHKASHEILTAAFKEEAPAEEPDRVYLLCLGLWKSFKEVYVIPEEGVTMTGLDIQPERLKRLHRNISHANWRMKTARDRKGKLLFLTNALGDDGVLNMGYEVIMTRLLTWIEDDIVMRGGLPDKYLFRASTFFVGLIL